MFIRNFYATLGFVLIITKKLKYGVKCKQRDVLH